MLYLIADIASVVRSILTSLHYMCNTQLYYAAVRQCRVCVSSVLIYPTSSWVAMPTVYLFISSIAANHTALKVMHCSLIPQNFLPFIIM